jgi:transcription antitermination factor NusG
LLHSLSGKEIILNAESTTGLTPSNPEALVYAPAEEQMAASAKLFTSGQQVRINAYPLVGQTGTIEKIIQGQVSLPNGLKVAAASIIMDNNERKTVPITNLDVIGFSN